MKGKSVVFLFVNHSGIVVGLPEEKVNHLLEANDKFDLYWKEEEVKVEYPAVSQPRG